MKELRMFLKSLIRFQSPSIILLHEKCPNMKFSLVHIFLYSVQIQKNTDQKKSVFGHFSRSVRPSLILTHFYIEKKSFDLPLIPNDSFLYAIQNWDEIS